MPKRAKVQPRTNPDFYGLAPMPVGDHLVPVRRRTPNGASVVVERIVQVEKAMEQAVNPIHALNRAIETQKTQD